MPTPDPQTITARSTFDNSTRCVSMAIPCRSASRGVTPTWATSGSVYVQCGMTSSDTRFPAPSSAFVTASLAVAIAACVNFSGWATDNQGAAIPVSNLTWSLVLKHGANPPHEHFVQNFPGVACPSFPGVACGSFQAPDHDFPSELELSLTATDSSGLASTASVQLQPLTTTLRFATNPTGLTLTFNGANATAPFDRTVIVNSTNSVSAPSPQNLRGSGKQVFKSWSDGALNLDPADEIAGPVTITHGGEIRSDAVKKLLAPAEAKA